MELKIIISVLFLNNINVNYLFASQPKNFNALKFEKT